MINRTYERYTTMLLILWRDHIITDEEHAQLMARLNDKYRDPKEKQD